MILIKLGGSIITNKSRPLSARRAAVRKIARVLRRIKEPLVIVHGGGSYGHYWSVKYDMHTKPARYGARGVSVVKNSMVELDKIILDVLSESGLNPYCLPPAGFVSGDTPVAEKIAEIRGIARSGLVPVTYGDALWYGRGRSYILSGDRIMGMIAGVLRPRLSIFALDVDGLYSDPRTKSLIPEMRGHLPDMPESGMDVTGGMRRKVLEAQSMAESGLTVFFVNGNRPERIANATTKRRFEGTLFRRAYV